MSSRAVLGEETVDAAPGKGTVDTGSEELAQHEQQLYSGCVFEVRRGDGGPLNGPVLVLGGHSAAVASVEWCPGSNMVVTAGEDGAVCVYTLFRVS